MDIPLFRKVVYALAVAGLGLVLACGNNWQPAPAPPPVPEDVAYQWKCQSPQPVSEEVYGVCALSASDVWAVGGSLHGGTDGTILHYDGTDWQVQASAMPKALFGLAALGPSNVWAVGADGAILHYDGADWQAQTSGTNRWLYGISMLNAQNGWAVGHGGTILHYDGVEWSPQDSGTSYQLRGISALDATNAWAVGDQGTILHYDGARWSPQATDCTEHLRSVCAKSTNDVWAVGYNSAILHYDGNGWTQKKAPNIGTTYRSVSVTSAGDVWIAGMPVSDGGLIHYDGQAWHVMPSEKRFSPEQRQRTRQALLKMARYSREKGIPLILVTFQHNQDIELIKASSDLSLIYSNPCGVVLDASPVLPSLPTLDSHLCPLAHWILANFLALLCNLRLCGRNLQKATPHPLLIVFDDLGLV